MWVNAQGWRQGESEVSVYLNTPSDIQYISQQHWNYDAPSGIPGKCRLYLTPDELKDLSVSGLKYDISISDLNAYYRNFWSAKVPSGYYTYQQIISIADSLQTAFPAICKKLVIGYSMGGRQLAVLKISDNVNADEAEPEIFFEAGIHGDEIGGSENLIRYAREICKGYGINSQYTTMINQSEIFLLLMANPDGREGMTRYNNNGVDLNRDCGYMWNAEGNSTGPFSQQESKLIRDFVFSNQFTSFTDYHSGIEIVSCPWSYRPQSPPDMQHILSLASVYSTNSGYSSLTYGQGYSLMYPINGSTKDYSYGSMGGVSWSMEISNEKQPPSSQIYSYYAKNRSSMSAVINHVSYGLRGTIKDSVNGNPIAATIIVNNGLPVYSDPLVGDYFKYVMAGSYSIKVMANGYKSKTITGVSVPALGFSSNDFLLSKKDEAYAYKVLISYISGNNNYDEGYTWASLGESDGIRYSLGKSGYIVLDMGDTLRNIQGNDFRIIEDDNSPEGYSVYISSTMDGPWTFVGNGTGTTSFDMQSIGVSKARYLKIVDDGDGPTLGADAGFDLDAVQNLYIMPSADFAASSTMPCVGSAVNFTDLSTGNITAWKWTFQGGTPSTSLLQNPTGIVYSNPGNFDVSLRVFDGVSYQTRNTVSYIQAFMPPLTPSAPTGNTQICQAHTASFAINPPANWQSIGWQVQPESAGLFSGNEPNVMFYASATFTGQAAISAQVLTECGISAFSPSLLLSVIPGPVVDLGADTLLCPDQSIVLDASYNGASYLWSNGAITPTITVDLSSQGYGLASYYVKTTAPNLCADTDTIRITFDECTGNGELNNNDMFSLYPIPASSSLFIASKILQGETFIEIIDISGQHKNRVQVYFQKNSYELNVSNLKSGIYFLRVSNNIGSIVKKFSVVR